MLGFSILKSLTAKVGSKCEIHWFSFHGTILVTGWVSVASLTLTPSNDVSSENCNFHIY